MLSLGCFIGLYTGLFRIMSDYTELNRDCMIYKYIAADSVRFGVYGRQVLKPLSPSWGWGLLGFRVKGVGYRV